MTNTPTGDSRIAPQQAHSLAASRISGHLLPSRSLAALRRVLDRQLRKVAS